MPQKKVNTFTVEGCAMCGNSLDMFGRCTDCLWSDGGATQSLLGTRGEAPYGDM